MTNLYKNTINMVETIWFYQVHCSYQVGNPIHHTLGIPWTMENIAIGWMRLAIKMSNAIF